MAFCTECGTPMPPGGSACPRCGAVTDAPPAAPVAPSAAAGGPGWNAAPPQAPPGPPPGWNAPPQQAPGPPPGWNASPQQAPGPPPGWNAAPQQAPGPPPGWNAPPQQAPGPPPGWNAPPQQAPPGPPPGWNAPPPPGGPGWGAAPPAAPGIGDVQHVLQQMLADIRSFNIRWVVPVDTALSPALLHNRTVWVMLLFGFYPLLASNMKLLDTPDNVVRTLLIYCALAWAGYFFYFVCKRSVDFKIGGAVTLFTAFIGIQLVFVLWSLPPFSIIHPFTEPGRDVLSQLIGYTLGVGVIEEFTKAVPVLVLAYGMGKVEKPLDGIFFGAMSGLGFGIAEGVQYILGQGSIVQVLIRLTTLPFMHALWAATVGYFIGLSQINKSRGPALVLLGYAVGVVEHGTYDTFCGVQGIIALGIAAVSYLIFAAYLERSQQMIEELLRAERVANRESTIQTIFRDTYLPSMHGGAPPPAAPGQGAP